MVETKLEAVVIASGTSLRYFTGARWGLSERFFGLVLTREGAPAWVTPAFEKERAEEQIELGDDIRAWEEHESPYALIAAILADRKVKAGRVGIEETIPYAFVSGISEAAPAAEVSLATPVTAGCRMIKDAHELDLMRRANQNSVRAHRAVFASLKEGMTQVDVAGLSAAAHRRLGMRGGALVLFGKDAAFPHGTTQPEPLKPGDVVLIDGGGRYQDYASDITRTGVLGRLRRTASARSGTSCEMRSVRGGASGHRVSGSRRSGSQGDRGRRLRLGLLVPDPPCRARDRHGWPRVDLPGQGQPHEAATRDVLQR